MADEKPSVSTYQGAISYGFGPVGRAANAKHGIAKAARNGINPYQEIGRTGLRQWGGYVLEEWLSELQGKRAAEMYREMQDQDPIIGGMLFAAEMLVRRVTWWVEPASTSNKADEEASVFAQQCLFEDLEHSWSDVITEVLSMLGYGYHLAEVVYKKRNGESRDPGRNSKFADGRIGIAKLATRSQDSLLHWEFDDHDDWTAFIQQPPPTYTTYRIPREKALLFRTKVHKQNPEGFSLLRRCVRPYYFKKNIETLRGIGIERDLAGYPILTPPDDVNLWNTSDPATVQLLAQAQAMVSQVRRDELEGAVMPTSGWKLDLVKSGGQRQVDVNAVVNYYDQRMAMSMVADMITLGADKVGSYALAGAKKDLFSAALEAFLDQIGATINTFLLPPLFKINGWQGLTDWPKLCHGPVQDVDLETIAATLQAMGAAGAPVFAGDSEDKLLNALLERMGLPSVAADDTSENE